MTIKVASFIDSIKAIKPFNSEDAGRNALMAALTAGGLGATAGAIKGMVDKPEIDPQTGQKKNRAFHILSDALGYGAGAALPAFAVASSLPALSQLQAKIQGSRLAKEKATSIANQQAPLLAKLIQKRNENKTLGDLV